MDSLDLFKGEVNKVFVLRFIEPNFSPHCLNLNNNFIPKFTTIQTYISNIVMGSSNPHGTPKSSYFVA